MGIVKTMLFCLILALSLSLNGVFLLNYFGGKADEPPEEKNEDNNGWLPSWKTLMIGGAAIAGPLLAPFALGMAGFTALGVQAGSLAAYIQSVAYGGFAAGVFSTLQSAGAAGIGLVGNLIVSTTSAGFAAAVYGAWNETVAYFY